MKNSTQKILAMTFLRLSLTVALSKLGALLSYAQNITRFTLIAMAWAICLIGYSQPAAPVATAATNVKSAQFTATWQAVAGATSYRLDVSTDNFVNFAFDLNNKNVNADLSYKYPGGYTPGTTYKYRVRAVDANGSSVNSNVIEVTTALINYSQMLDTSFGTGGTVTTSLGTQDNLFSVAIQSDGKIVAAGNTTISGIQRFALARYNTNGSLDNTFGIGGIVTTAIPSSTMDAAGAVAIQSDGKIVAAGYTLNSTADFVVIRYEANGTPDTGFDTDGIAITPVGTGHDFPGAIIIQADGKIVLAGRATTGTLQSFGLARFNMNGSLDSSFDTDGVLTTDFGTTASGIGSIALQTDGKIVAAGSGGTGGHNHAMARYNTDGSLDNTFDTDGKLTSAVGVGKGVALQSDGKIVVAIAPDKLFGLVRYTTAGILDNTFGIAGIVTTATDGDAELKCLLLQPDGKIIVAGSSYTGTSLLDFALARYLTDGSLDNTFGNGGKLYTDMGAGGNVINSLALQADGKIVAGGILNAGTTSDFAIVRYIGSIAPSTPVPVAIAATAISTTGFTANWNAVSGATGYKLDVSADNFVNYVSTFSNKSVAGTSDVVTGLTANTLYKYRVRAVDANGTSLNSNTIEVTTSAGIAPPVAIASTNKTATGFTVNWNAAAGATSYRLDISSTSFTTFISGYDNKTVNSLSEVVSGLTPNTTYQYRVRAVDANGTSANSNAIFAGTPSEAPVAIAPTSISTTSFTANWNAVAGVTNYGLFVSADNFATFLSGYKLIAGTTQNVSGLTSNTAYKYRVRALSGNGESDYSNVIDVSTSGSGIAASVATAATAISQTGFTANWNVVAGATGYKLDLSVDNFATFVAGFADKSISGNIEIIAGLLAGTPYQYRVRTVDANGASTNSNVIGVTTLSKQSQTITFNALPTKVFGDVPFQLTATASSGLPVSLISSNPAVATINGTTVTIVGAGTISISANQAGNTEFSEAPTVKQVLTVGKANQTITFAALSNKLLTDGSFALTATASSGLSVVYTSSNIGVATITGSTATLVAAGTTTITASQGGNDNYNAAVPVGRELVVSAMQDQTITFNSLAGKVFGDAPFQLTATASSALPVTYASSNAAVATISGTTVTIVGVGTSIITATQAGNTVFNAAPSVAQTLTVGKANQTITFAAIADKTLGDAPFALTATASSTLAVSFATTSDKITISAGQVTLVKAGRAAITASQAGNTSFNAAAPVEKSFCIKPAKPTITTGGANTETATLTSNAAAGNQWFRNGAAITGATAATFTIAAEGVYKVQVKVDDCLSEFSAEVPVLVTGDLTSQAQRISIAPNPVDSYFEVHGINGEVEQSQLYDLTGRSHSINLEKSGNAYYGNVPHLVQGVYVLRVLQGKTVSQIKFIKK